MLCALLASTGIAGQPQSYFRKEDTAKWAKRFNVPMTETRPADSGAFLNGVLSAGTSPNGVFSVRIMWGSLEEVLDALTTSGITGPCTDAERMQQAFGPMRFLSLRRLDTLAQAISWARAEQTRVWHKLDSKADQDVAASPAYDFDQIHTLRSSVQAHNAAWQAWFDANGIAPMPLTYEALDANPTGVVAKVLDYLGLDLSKADTIGARNIRMADALSYDWAERYRLDLAARGGDA